MSRRTLSSIFVGLFMVAVALVSPSATSGQESEREEGMRRAHAAIAELATARRQLTEKLEQAEESGSERDMQEIRARIAETDARLKQIEARVRNATGESGRQEATGSAKEHPEISAAREQVKHLRAAQEHLAAIEFKDMAEMVGKRADQIQQAIRRHETERKEQSTRGRQEPDRADRADQLEMIVKELNGAIRQLREDVKQLREEVSGLRERAERNEKSER